jgi:LmbE family N-acetylglucosaminyl deacetylase
MTETERIAELEEAIREAQTRALLMSGMRLTDLQRITLANVIEPLSAIMSGQPDHFIG